MGVRCEIWDRANARRRAIVHSITAAERTAAIGRDETLSLEGSASDAAWGSLSRASVLRLQTEGEAADFSLWRVTRSGFSRGPGALTRKISAQALWMDLRHGRVNQPQADGSVLFVFGMIGLTPTEWLTSIILPGYAGDALAFELGVVELDAPVDLTFEQPTTPLEALRMLEQASQGEVQFRYSPDGATCYVDLLERVGGAAGGARLRYGHNITGLERYEDDTDSISRIYAVGSGILSLADATWPITAVGGVAGARVLSFTKSPVFEDGAFVGGYLSIGGITYLITASAVAGGTITVDEGAHAVPVAGDVALLCSDAAGSRLAYLESPSARAEVGVRTGELADASDVPDARNLVANSDYASWAAGIPVSWSTLGVPTLTQVTDPLYARHGSTAVQVDAAAADEGLISDAFEIPTGDSRRPYLGISAALTVLSGEVRLELRHSNGEVYPLQERPGPTGTGVYDVVSAGPVDEEPLPAGTGRLALVSHGGAASFVADAVMATPQLAAEVPGYVGDQGAWVLWDRAVDDLRLRMVQAREYSVDVVDLYRVDPARFAFHELRLGDDCQVWDPDFGGAETLRIVELTTDVLHPEGARVSVAPGPWQRPIRSDADLFRPRYTQRRPSFASTAPRPRASLLDVSQQWDDSAGELYVTALGNSATATLELRTKSSRDVAYPAAASQTEAGRSATFGAAVSRTESLYWKVTAKDGRGVAGEAREGSITNGQLSLQGQSEAAAMRQDLQRIAADREDRESQYSAVSGNEALDPASSAATNLDAAWLAYAGADGQSGAYGDLVGAIEAAVADGYVDDDDRTAYTTAAAAYATALGVLAQRLQEALDATAIVHGAKPPTATITATSTTDESYTLQYAGALGEGGAGALQWRRRILVGELVAQDWTLWAALVPAPAPEAVAREPLWPQVVELEVRYQDAPALVGSQSYTVPANDSDLHPPTGRRPGDPLDPRRLKPLVKIDGYPDDLGTVHGRAAAADGDLTALDTGGWIARTTRRLLAIDRSGVQVVGGSLFERGVSTALDVVESTGRWFTDNAMLDPSRRIVNVYRGATLKGVGDLYDMASNTLDNVSEGATYGRTVGSYLSGGKVNRLLRGGLDEVPDNLFKRLSDTSLDVVEGAGRGFLDQAMWYPGTRYIGSVYRGGVESVGNLGKIGVDFAQGATVGATWGTNVGGRPTELTDGRVAAAIEAAGARLAPIPWRRGAGGVDMLPTDLYRLSSETLDDVSEGATYGRTVGSYLSGGKVNRLLRGGLDEVPDNLFKRLSDTSLDVMESTGRGFVDQQMWYPNTRYIGSVYRGGVESVANLGKIGVDFTSGADVTAANQAKALLIPDTRNTNTPPSGYGRGTWHEFKSANTLGITSQLGLPDVYGALETVKQWENDTGGDATQTFRSSYGIFQRRGGCGAAAWGPWTRPLDGAYRLSDQRRINQLIAANVSSQQLGLSLSAAWDATANAYRITASAHSVRYGFGTVSYTSQQQYAAANSDAYCYYDDPDYAGGSPGLKIATAPDGVIADGRYFVGSIHLGAAGGTTTGGTGGGTGGGGIQPPPQT